MLCLVAGLLGTVVAPADAAPAANPNPIDWKVEKLFYDQTGGDIPLRTGQADYQDPKTKEVTDGFGRVHIQSSQFGHGTVPPSTDIQDTIASPANCILGPDVRMRCLNPDTNLFVVYSPVPDPRSGDSYVFGIITAYYTLPCVVPAAGPVRPACGSGPTVPAAPTTLTYTGPANGTNGGPLEMSASLTDDLGIPVRGKTLRFTVGSGAAAQSCDGVTGAAGSARCTVDTLHQAAGSAPVTVAFAGDSGFTASSVRAGVALSSPTKLAYTGPADGVNGRPLALSAALTDYAGRPVGGETVRLTVGSGAAAQSCTGTTTASGDAACTIDDLRQPPHSVPVVAAFAGGDGFGASDASATIAVRSPTTLTYSGPSHLANGTGADLSGVLKDYLGAPVAARPVRFVLGTGTAAQSCDAVTDAAGTARCTVARVDQPLDAAATVGLRASFAGDDSYLPSTASADLLLEYYTGRSYGLSAGLTLPLLPVTLPPQPDTGGIRTATAGTTTPPCAGVALLVIGVKAACPAFTTTLAPGTATATASVADATIGLPGVPVIGVSALTATATSRCSAATGTVRLTLTVGGTPVSVPTAPNSTLTLPGGTRLVVDEQLPVAGADRGITVNALHVVAAGGLGDVIIGSTTSAVHHCGP